MSVHLPILKFKYVVFILLLLTLSALACNISVGSSPEQAVVTIPPTRTPLPTFTPTPLGFVMLPTATPGASQNPAESSSSSAAAAPTVTPAPPAKTSVQAVGPVNVRNGPGTVYSIIGLLDGGESADITGKNQDGTWWQIAFSGGTGWVKADLVTTSGETGGVAIAQAPPTPAAPPTPKTPPTATPAPQPTAAPAPQYPYSLKNMFGQTNEAITQIRGIIKDKSGAPVNGVLVRVRAGGSFCTISVASGTTGVYPPGNYDILLDTKAKDGSWQVDIVESGETRQAADCQTRKALSETVNATTGHVEGVAYVEWVKN
jgi:uncharacterized protein YraI